MIHHPITGVTADSRQVKPGFVFVAIPGEKENGHQYIKEALSSGARLIISQERISPLPVPNIQVQDARRALSYTAACLYKHPGKKLRTIGITGTNGKSTTASLLHHLLKGEAGLISTIGSCTGKKHLPAGLTTPDAVNIQSLLSMMVKNQLQYAVIEVSSHGIHQHRVADIDFHLLIHTSISTDHLDYHRTFSEYLATKRSLFLENPESLALFNQDDPHFSALSRNCKNPSYTYGIQEKAQIKAQRIKERGLSSSFTITLPRKRGGRKNYQVHLPLPGRHNIYNALAAFCGGLLLGLKPENMIKGLNSFPGVWRRMQIRKKNGFTIIDDCAHNPGSYHSLFQALQRLSYRRLFIINAIRGNRGVWINQENAKTLGNCYQRLPASSLYITSAQDMTNASDRVTKEEELGFRRTLEEYLGEFSFTPTLREAIHTVLPKTRAGDLLLLAGAHAFDEAADLLWKEWEKG